MKNNNLCDFKAVVLCGGRGHNLRDLTENIPKFLLPVANKPLLYYPLRLCINAGFGSIVIVVSERDVRKMKDFLKSYFSNWESMGVTLCTTSADDDFGSLEVLVEYKQQIVAVEDNTCRDLFVISCDSIMDVNLQSVADITRLHECPLTCVLADNPSSCSDAVKVGNRIKRSKKFDQIVGLDPVDSNIVYFYQVATNINDTVSIPCSTFPSNRINIHTKLVDPHVYVISNQLLQKIADDEKLRENITRISSELIPYIIRKASYCDETVFSEYSTEIASTMDADKLSAAKNGLKPCRYFKASPENFVWRANSIDNFYEANRRILDMLLNNRRPGGDRKGLVCCGLDKNTLMGTNLVHGSGLNNANSSAGVESLCEKKGDHSASLINTKLVERCIIGSDFTIGKQSKLSACVLFSNVTIGDNCKLVNCILASNCTVGNGCELNNVLVASDQNVQPNAKLNFETVKQIVQFQ